MTRQRRLLVLAICSTSLLLVGLDATIVNVALPAIGDAFGSAVSGLQWTVDAYAVVLASLLMLSGSVADRFGRRRVFVVGLAVFSLGSLACAVAPTLGLLIASRALQAVGGAMLSPATMSIVRNTFEDPRERAQAIGVYGAMFGISMGLGPVVGGFLVSALSWRAVFAVAIPFGAVAMVLALRLVPESQAPRPRRFDPVGQVLVAAALTSTTFAVIEDSWVVGAVALGCFAALVPYELRRREPLLELRFFRNGPFAGAVAIAVIASAALGGFLFLNTLYLQDVRTLTPSLAGLMLLPAAATMIVVPPLTGRLMGHVGTRLPLVAGGLVVMVSGLLLTGFAHDTPLPYVLGTYALFGCGFSLISPTIAHTAVSGMPPEQAGVASAVATTGRQIGLTLGVAAFGAAGSRAGWWSVAAIGLTVALLGYATATRPARDRVAVGR